MLIDLWHMPNGGHPPKHFNDHTRHRLFHIRRIPKFIQVFLFFWVLYNYFVNAETFSTTNFSLIIGILGVQIWLNIKQWFR